MTDTELLSAARATIAQWERIAGVVAEAHPNLSKTERARVIGDLMTCLLDTAANLHKEHIA